MKRDEAKQSLLDYYNAVRSYFDAYLHGIGDIAKAQQNLNSIRDKLLAALTGSDRPEVDLSERILDIPVTVPDDLPCMDSAKCFVIGFRTAQLAAAARTTGTWRKVEEK